MRRGGGGPLLRYLWAGTAVAALASGLSFRRDRASLEHGNRLYRDGRVEAAEEVYRGRVGAAAASGSAEYNLGTALLSLDSPEAERHLRLAAQEETTGVAGAGSYNLAYHLLERFDAGLPPDSALLLLTDVVGYGRTALTLDPSSENARWNLALAQRMLDSVTLALVPDEVRPREDRADRDEEGGIVIQEAFRPGPRGVEQEALAGEDSGALTEGDARLLLDLVDPSVEPLVRGLMWSHRPDVNPWEEPYPGGNR